MHPTPAPSGKVEAFDRKLMNVTGKIQFYDPSMHPATGSIKF